MSKTFELLKKMNLETSGDISIILNDSFAGKIQEIELFGEKDNDIYDHVLFRCHKMIFLKSKYNDIFDSTTKLLKQLIPFDIKWKNIKNDCFHLSEIWIEDCKKSETENCIVFEHVDLKAKNLLIKENFIIESGMKINDIPIEYLHSGIFVLYGDERGTMTNINRMESSGEYVLDFRFGMNVICCSHKNADDVTVM